MHDVPQQDPTPQRPLNIAFFCDAYRPTCSGVAVSVETTARELRARGHRVTIYAPRYKNYEEHDPNVIRFPAGHWYLAKDFPVAWPLLPRASLRVGTRFRRAKYDIVHSHSPYTIGTTGARWARRNGIPVVFSFHTLYHHYLHYVPMPSSWTRSYILQALRYYMGLCDHIIAPSRPVMQIAACLRPKLPCSIIPTGIDVEHFANGQGDAFRTQLKIDANEIVLLYVGRIVREKNLEFLLRSLAPLLHEYSIEKNLPRVRLVLAGNGMDLDDMQEIARELRIENNVIFTGFIPPENIADLYAAADIFVFASRTETQGISIAEALAAGLPCVVVGAMGAAESVAHGEDGLVVPPREEPFRQAVTQLIEDSQLRQTMSRNARLRSPQLSQSFSADSLLKLYSQLLKS